MKKRICSILVCLLVSVLALGCSTANGGAGPAQPLAQTDVNNARHLVDERGVPVLDIEGVGQVYHPFWIAAYALQYAGADSMYDPEVEPDAEKFENCIDWLKENAKKTRQSSRVWEYTFDSTYNATTIEAPWFSAFGQAVCIEALLEYHAQTGDAEALELARAGALELFESVEDGGLLFTAADGSIWFEEIPAEENPSHILNGHMRSLIALQKLYQATGDSLYQDWYARGAESLAAWLPLYDTGGWLRYDLAPKTERLLFRFNNPYGYLLPELAIDSITLTDSVTGESRTLDVGAAEDGTEDDAYIAGTHWQAEEELDGRTVRRLSAAAPGEEGGGPHTYFYLDLPTEWTDNLRTEGFELTVTYKDEAAGNVGVELRGIHPGEEYTPLRSGELLLTGSGQWREWTVEVRANDLGWWVGELYGEKHMLYLEWLAAYSPELEPWAERAAGYYNAVATPEDIAIVSPELAELPVNTPVMAFAIDDAGIVTQHYYVEGKTGLIGEGLWDRKSFVSEASYSPFIVAQTALDYFSSYALNSGANSKQYRFLSPETAELIQPQAAFQWLMDNAVSLGGNAVTWLYDTDNSYNDMSQTAPWQSAFSQPYCIRALLKRGETSMAEKAINAYAVLTEDGGLSSLSADGVRWFEEVPNNTHILNAHLASLAELSNCVTALPDSQAEALLDAGLSALKEKLHLFDTGYWSRYDLNPRKDPLFRIQPLSGEASPQISAIQLYNPQSNTAAQIDCVGENAFTGGSYLSGNAWMALAEGEEGRGFLTTGENAAYFRLLLPQQTFTDYFDVPTHQLIIRYQDVAEGDFAIEVQSINEGNVLTFTEIPGGILTCTGDGEWKTAVIDIPPQNLGWFMGVDYQLYHNEQLGLIAQATGDRYLQQTLEKWEYYIACHEAGTSPIIKNTGERAPQDLTGRLTVLESSPTYEGFGVENSLDGDPNDDYTAFLESEEVQSFTLGFETAAELEELQLTFESESNYLTDYDLAFYLEGEQVSEVTVTNQTAYQQTVSFGPVLADSFTITAQGYQGDARILMRELRAYSFAEEAA